MGLIHSFPVSGLTGFQSLLHGQPLEAGAVTEPLGNPLVSPHLPKALGPPQHPIPELFTAMDPGPGSKHLPFLAWIPFLSSCEDLSLPPQPSLVNVKATA